ncbi:hypothetical protein AYM40_07655 [Paraburkholderia phytofirmans OLGA172]|uniref:Uncharacterized protein n=1 Tax=Paraburkholderia phytofirmans OLGA172 TaxID=1417228 RepID=A0A160FIW5_9BURK|nr:hypothetical protein AYM40_07655 [Paraburkholderia phytofirmans OLGA172]
MPTVTGNQPPRGIFRRFAAISIPSTIRSGTLAAATASFDQCQRVGDSAIIWIVVVSIVKPAAMPYADHTRT